MSDLRSPQPIRRSQRVTFPGGNGFPLGGIIDLPHDQPLAAILFTHCFTCNKDLKAIVRISRGLAEWGFLVLRYDLTGLGHSQGDFSHTNFSTNRADLAAAAEFLAANFQAPDFLIGYSFGGACSLSMVEELDSVRGAISIAAPSDTSHLADLLGRMDPEITRSGSGTVEIGGRSYHIRREMLDDFRRHDLPGMLRRVQKPVVLFHSPRDATLGFEHALRLYSLLTQREASDPPPAATSLMCLPEADHLLTEHPADIAFVTDTIAAWLKHRLTRK